MWMCLIKAFDRIVTVVIFLAVVDATFCPASTIQPSILPTFPIPYVTRRSIDNFIVAQYKLVSSKKCQHFFNFSCLKLELSTQYSSELLIVTSVYVQAPTNQ